MKSLLEVYGLNEAKEKMISQTAAEKRWPDSMPAFDRDIGQNYSHATFFISKEMYDKGPKHLTQDSLVANVNGGGWWKFEEEGPVWNGDSGGVWAKARWVKVDKPSKERGSGHQSRSVKISGLEVGFGPGTEFDDLVRSGQKLGVRVSPASKDGVEILSATLVGPGESIVKLIRGMGYGDDWIWTFMSSKGFSEEQVRSFGVEII